MDNSVSLKVHPDMGDDLKTGTRELSVQCLLSSTMLIVYITWVLGVGWGGVGEPVYLVNARDFLKFMS